MSSNRELSKTVKVTRVSAGATTAGTAHNTSAVNMAGFAGVIFFGRFATAHASNFASLAQSATSGGSFADLAGTKVVPGDNGDSFLIDVKRPPAGKPWVRCEIDRGGADTVLGDIYAIQYGSRKSNPGAGTTVDTETHVDIVEGSI